MTLLIVQVTQVRDLREDIKDSLYIEFSEKCFIPKNKMTKYESSSGYSSSSWDQVFLDHDDVNINITEYD